MSERKCLYLKPVIGGLLFWEKKKNLIKAVCVWLMLTILEMDKPKPGVELTLYDKISLQPDTGPLLKGLALTVLNYGYDPKSRLKKNVIYKVIVGSFMGYLRIFNPHPVKTGDGAQAEDLLLEVHLRDPILQVEVGKFVSGTEMLHLAVLHSRKLCVYSVSGSLGNVEHGTQYQIKLMYEHNLQRTACNMTYGSFGGVKGNLHLIMSVLL
eukprot:bmy_06484T0